ncbi:MAG: VacJ family lipoprotein [Methylococcaceae bacterium]|nr:VacJ family lipoprotein [Methylococcaceae bacterium]
MITQKTTIHKNLLLTSVAISMALGGCATTTGSDPNDVFHGWNQGTQSFNDDVDKAVLKPVAKGYMAVTPDAIDEGVTNFFSNLNDIGVTVNDLLQLKFLQGGMDLSRFVINTTAGVAGVFDVAKLVDLPKHDEDFGQTLGFWGVPAGPYLVLPFAGPSSPRDFVGLIGDALLNPLTYVSAFGGLAGGAATGGANALDVTDTRAGLMSTEKVVNEGSVNRYDFIKNAYEQHREYLVHDGNPPSNDPDVEEEVDSSSTAPAEMTNTANNKAMPSTTTGTTTTPLPNTGGPAPVINNSKHLLELTAPEEKNR